MKITLQPKPEPAEDRPERADITEESTFEAQILSIEHRETRWYATDRETGERLLNEQGEEYKNMEFNFKFVILDDDKVSPAADPRWVWGSTSDWFSTSDRCKLANWIRAILDEPVLPDGFQLETEDLVGMRCRVVVQAKKKDDGRYSNWVSTVYPSRGGETTQDRVQAHLAKNDADGGEPAAAYDPNDEPF